MSQHVRHYALSIVIPVYRGADSIGILVDALAALEIAGGHEVILVNDGSPDNSAEVCRRLAARTDLPVTFIDLSRNFGEHNAVMAGLRYIRGDYVITMDDDLQNPISEVVKLFEHARAGGWDVVYTYYAQKKHAAWRNLGSRFANKVADVLLDKPRGLYLSSFRCMSAFVARCVTRYEGPFPYIDGLIMQSTQHIDSIQVEHMARASGQSNYTIRRLVRLWLNLFINFSAMPLRLSVVAGFVIGLCGMIGCIIVVAEALLRAPPPGWASLMAATLLISGVQMVMLGIIGEYLGRLFLTANRKPQSLVREVVPPAAEEVTRLGPAQAAEGAPRVQTGRAAEEATRFQAAQRKAI
jgi:undecaprenyl-phosphate 4-deoxy-4-formamido-L-arabinose transferase